MAILKYWRPAEDEGIFPAGSRALDDGDSWGSQLCGAVSIALAGAALASSVSTHAAAAQSTYDQQEIVATAATAPPDEDFWRNPSTPLQPVAVRSLTHLFDREEIPAGSLSAPWVFPLSVHSSGRYLIDANGKPFPVLGDSGWEAPHNINAADQEAFLEDRIARGFNAVLLEAVEHDFTASKPPKDLAGNLPFTLRLDGGSYTGSPNGTPTASITGNAGQYTADPYSNVNNESPDFTRPTAAYWAILDAYVANCAQKGIACFVFPLYFGSHPEQGWSQELVANDAVTGAGGQTGQSFADPTKSKLWNFGAWLANRYKSANNIIWLLGGDYGVPIGSRFTAPQSNAELQLFQGMTSVAGQASTIWTGHWDGQPGGLATDISVDATNGAALAAAMQLQATRCAARAAEFARNGYAATPAMPSFQLEGFYENNGAGPSPNRQVLWWNFLGGIAGQFFGNESEWPFATGWQATLSSPGSLDAQRLNGFVSSIQWWRLVPSGLSGMKTLVTSGGGTASPQSTDYVAGAATVAGDLLVLYVPPAHTGTVTVDMTAMGGLTRSRWFDPTAGTFTADATGLAASGTHVFTAPGTNVGGATDWLLFLDSAISVDEDFWQNEVATVQATFGKLYLPDPEEIVVTAVTPALDDGGWVAPLPVGAPSPALRLWDGDDLPAGSLFGQADEDFWVSGVAPTGLQFARLYLPDAEELVVTTPPPFSLDDALWTAPLPAAFVQRVTAPWDGDDVPAGSLFGQPDEDFWTSGLQPTPYVFGKLYLPDPEELAVTPPPSFSLDDTAWAPASQQLFVQRVLQPWDGDDVPAGSLFGQPDEDFWINQVLPVQFVQTQRLPIADLEEVLPLPAIGVDEDFDVRLIVRPAAPLLFVPLYAYDSQEFVQFIAPVVVDEDFWRNPVAPVQATFGKLFLPDADDVPAGFLRGMPDEDFDVRMVVRAPNPYLFGRLYAFDGQEIVPAPIGRPLFHIGPPIIATFEAPYPIIATFESPYPIICNGDNTMDPYDYKPFPIGEGRSIPVTFSGPLPTSSPALIFTIRDPVTGTQIQKMNAAAGGSDNDFVPPPLDGANVPTGSGYVNMHRSDTLAVIPRAGTSVHTYEVASYDPANQDGTYKVEAFGSFPFFDHASIPRP